MFIYELSKPCFVKLSLNKTRSCFRIYYVHNIGGIQYFINAKQFDSFNDTGK